MPTKSTKIHPLENYIQNWQAFNAVDRRQFHIQMLQTLGASFLYMAVISFLTA
ncbi:hypothetical protein [Marinoscillum sp.]|uniref:hypothetical protein n=1 Tax=Marinoscillum sp. TaxID=2024838 RepID=UPI003BAB3395